MNNVEELKQFAISHARAQRVPLERCESVLARIAHDGDGPGSWTAEWSAAAAESERQGRLQDACSLYYVARFPFVDGPARAEALTRSQETFARWQSESGAGLQPLDIELPEGRVQCYTTGLPVRGDRPCVIVLGGIVSTKEQYAQILLRLAKLGLSGIATEMPGTGSNTVPYGPDSWRMLSGIIDAVEDRLNGARVYAMALSFSGHTALRCALEDRRISGVVTMSTPVSRFYTDPDWQRALPAVTVDTLAHMAGTGSDEIGRHMRDWALTEQQLQALEVPVAYVSSRRDEIVPATDTELLKRHVRRLTVLDIDDVHAAPTFLDMTGPWLTLSLLRMHGSHLPQRAALRSVVSLARARHRLAGHGAVSVHRGTGI
ncbi:alpha/beta hydrolase [Kitasatospora sp. NPDC008115]|uniref:alpha/beta hydrolase n=1 Tax=Kitasatospora sp. NPDC008115 TaxID=3364022 RepID=UPI0036EB4071